MLLTVTVVAPEFAVVVTVDVGICTRLGRRGGLGGAQISDHEKRGEEPHDNCDGDNSHDGKHRFLRFA